MKFRVGDKIVEAELNGKGVPVVKAKCETITRADGGQDVIVHVPCLQIAAKANKE